MRCYHTHISVVAATAIVSLRSPTQTATDTPPGCSGSERLKERRAGGRERVHAHKAAPVSTAVAECVSISIGAGDTLYMNTQRVSSDSEQQQSYTSS